MSLQQSSEQIEWCLAGSGARQILIDGVFCGKPVKIMLDTGATCSFISRAFADKFKEDIQMKSGDTMKIRLGNDSTETVNLSTTGELFVGDDVETKVTLHSMNLPGNGTEFQILAGMDWIEDNHVIIDGRDRRISLRSAGDQTRHIVAYVSSPIHIYSDSTGMLEYAVYHLQNDTGEDLEMQNISSRMMRKLRAKMKLGSLTFNAVENYHLTCWFRT